MNAQQKKQQQELDRAALAAQDLPKIHAATVTTVQPGAAKGGAALVTVDYRGGSLPATYAAHYTPNTGDRVSVGDCEGNIHITGRIIGHPNTGGV